MNLEREAVKQVFDRVHNQTEAVQNGTDGTPELTAFFESQGVDIQQSLFPTLIAADEGIFTGTIVNQDRRVFEFFVDLNDLDDYEFEDVTEELGPKDPEHPMADCMEVITMSLMYFDHNKQKKSA